MTTLPKPPLGSGIDRSNMISRGLRACWLFNEGAGSTIADIVQPWWSIPFTNAFPSLVTWKPSAYGAVIDFNALSFHFGGFAPSPIFSNLPKFTLHFLYYARNTSQGQLLGRTWGASVLSGGLIFDWPSTGSYFQITAGSGLVANAWNHITFAMDTTSAANSSIYVNGVDVTSGRINFTGSLSSDTGVGMAMGGTGSGAGGCDGQLALIYWWDRRILASEIASLVADPYQIARPFSWRPPRPGYFRYRFPAKLLFSPAGVSVGVPAVARQVATARSAVSTGAPGLTRQVNALRGALSVGIPGITRLVGIIRSAASSGIAGLVSLFKPKPAGRPRFFPTLDCRPRKLSLLSREQFEQSPAETRIYELALFGDSFGSAAWSISPTGPTLAPVAPAGNITSVLVSGMEAGTQYRLSIIATGSTGQQYEAACDVECASPEPAAYWSQGIAESRLYQITLNGDAPVSPNPAAPYAAAWSIAPGGPSITPLLASGKTVSALVSGIGSGEEYLLDAVVNCSSGQVVEQSVKIEGMEP